MAASSQKSMPDELYLARDILDKLLVDRNHQPLGRADGIAMVLEGDKPMRLARIECGPSVLGRRLGHNAQRMMTSLARRFGMRKGKPIKLAWSRIQSVSREIVLNNDAERSPALVVERWLVKRVIQHIPMVKR